MSLPGPILVVSDHHDRKLMAGLAGAGAFPVVECKMAEAAATIGQLGPAAVVFADPEFAPAGAVLEDLIATIDAAPAPFMPVVARVKGCGPTALDVLPVDAAAGVEQVVARTAAALRVRVLHATVLRRIDTLRGNGADVAQLPAFDPLDEATVLVAGRGRGYPALTAAVGSEVGLIGALSVENAARHLNTRDVDGLIIGDGFGPSTVEAFLTALAADSRFRDLPIGLVAEMPPAIERGRLANLEPVSGDPGDIVAHMLPMVRVHSFSTRLRRHIVALDSRGTIDPQTGLYTISAFARDMPRVVADAKTRRVPMSIARFAFPSDLGWRFRIDAARLTDRLLRPIDFACQTDDGSIVVVFAEAAPRSAHVIARKIASAMRQTMLDWENGDSGRCGIDPMVTLAFLKLTDTPESLLDRVSDPASDPAAVAAE
jgi:hypothetical protein